MNPLHEFAALFSNFGNIDPRMIVMWVVGGVLVYLAIKKEMEPTLLLPMGFGAILVNLPLSGAVTQIVDGVEEIGVLNVLFDAGIANELFPLLLFVGIGAMIDFEPLLQNPKLMLFGAAAQFGIFFTFSLAALLGFPIKDAAAIGIIGAADGPTSILVSQVLHSNYIGPIAVAAYSYMALVPIVQPPVIRLCTTQAERKIKMTYKGRPVSKTTKILFPIAVTVIGAAGAILFPMDDITDFLYLIGSVFAPMIAIQIADFFLQKRTDSLGESVDITNAVIWVIGFVLYRILMRIDIPVGNTLPDMVVTILICMIVRNVLKSKK